MPVFPFLSTVVDYKTELGIEARAWRSLALMEFFGKGQKVFRKLLMVDSGAPFSVLPYSLWHDEDLLWQPLGSQFFRGSRPDGAALNWVGAPCQFGETQVRLVNPVTGVRSNLLRLLAKFPVARVSLYLEKEAILGTSFLLENSVSQAVRGGGNRLDGVFLAD
jgi:hypothetical protein